MLHFPANLYEYLVMNSLGLDNHVEACYYHYRSYFHIESD